jgi:hypothetical protein
MLGGRSQRRRGRFQFGRGRAHRFDHLADGAFELVGKPHHVLATLSGAALLDFFLLGLHADLGEAVLAEHFRGLGNLSDLVLAIETADFDRIVARGELLEQTDDGPDRLCDAELAEQETDQATNDDTGGGQDDQEPRGRFVLFASFSAPLFDARVQAIGYRAHLGLELFGYITALHGGVAQLLGALAELRRLLALNHAQRRVDLTFVGGKRFADRRQHRQGLLVGGLADEVEALLVLLELGLDHLARRKAILVAGIDRTAELSAVERDHILVRACSHQGALR